MELTITMRDDERPMLEMIQKELGRGFLYPHVAKSPTPFKSKPRYMLRFHNAADTNFFVALFERYPLRSKKRYVFELWARVREELNKSVQARDQAYLRHLYQTIRHVRDYEQSTIEPYEPKGKQTTLSL